MVKKYSLTLCFLSLVTLTLTGCFGGGDDIQDERPESYTTYNAPAFSIYIPQDWEIIKQHEFSEDIPPQTQVVFRNNIKNDVFTSNANVTKKLLDSPKSSYDFANSSIEDNKATLLNYREISRNDEFNLIIGGEIEKTVLTMFEGKPDETSPTLRMVQTYAVNGADAYQITAAYLASADEFEAETAESIVKSFKIK